MWTHVILWEGGHVPGTMGWTMWWAKGGTLGSGSSWPTWWSEALRLRHHSLQRALLRSTRGTVRASIMGSWMGLWGPTCWGITVIGEEHALNIAQGLQGALAMLQLFLGQTLCVGLHVQQLLGQLLLLLLLLGRQTCSARTSARTSTSTSTSTSTRTSTRTSTLPSFTYWWRVEACLRLGDGGLIDWSYSVTGATAGKIFGFHAYRGRPFLRENTGLAPLV